VENGDNSRASQGGCPVTLSVVRLALSNGFDNLCAGIYRKRNSNPVRLRMEKPCFFEVLDYKTVGVGLRE